MSNESIEDKLNELEKWVLRGLVFMVTVAITGVFVAAWIVHNQNVHIESRAAMTDNAIACFIKGQYDRTIKGLPENYYYATHPDELQKQLNLVRDQAAIAVKVFGACDEGRQS